MSTLEDVDRFGPSLLTKYKIPIDSLDYSYIETCTDSKEMEKIVKILRSGEEGYYPDLIKAAEERLLLLKPNSKVLSVSCPVLDRKYIDKDDLKELDSDLANWLENIDRNNKELKKRKKSGLVDENLPKIREHLQNQQTEIEEKENPKRISACDYQSWDKYDPDTELLKIEIEEEKEKQKIIEEEKRTKQAERRNKKVSFIEFKTDAEAFFESEREREKGNECFKCGEYENALTHYSQSIKYKPSLAGYNNRAATFLKLNQYKEALNDCLNVLDIDSRNIKGLLRKATALEAINRYKEALETVDVLITEDPNNVAAQELANKLRKITSQDEGPRRRMIIEEI